MPDLISDSPATATTWTQNETLKRYRDRLKVAQRYRKDVLKLDDTWQRSIDLFSGKHFETDSKEDQIAVNLTFANVNVIGPSVSINYPKITVNAKNPDQYAQAAFAEACVNYWWRHYKFQPQFRDGIQDFLVIGEGWWKVGWRFEQDEQPRSDEAIQGDYAQMLKQTQDAAMANPLIAGDLPTDEQVAQGVPKTEMVTTADHPYCERIDPRDIYVDPEAVREHDMKWIAQRVHRPIEDVRKDKRYNATARKALTPDGTIQNEWSKAEQTDMYRRADIERVTLWEFYDLRQKKVSVFAEHGDGFLVAPTDFPYAYGQPFVMLRNYDVPGKFHPIGEIEMIEPLQRELNKTRSQLTTYRRRNRRKVLARKNALGTEGMRALASDQDNQVVYVEDDNRPFTEIVHPLDFPQMDAQLYNYSEVIENDIDRVSGVSDYMRGSAPDTRQTATAVNILQNSSNARASDKLARVELAIQAIAEHLLQLAQTYMEGEQVIRIAGVPQSQILQAHQAAQAQAGAPPQMGPVEMADGVHRMGDEMWLKFSREDIQGEFDFEVEAGSTQPRNDTVRRQQGIELLNTLGPFIGTVLDAQKVVLRVLHDSFGIKDAEALLAPPPDPNAPKGNQSERIIESMNFKDIPLEAQRQLLEDAGLPSDGLIDPAVQRAATAVATAQLKDAIAPKEKPAAKAK